MTNRLKQYLGLCFLLFVTVGVTPLVADWCRVHCALPVGYGAEGDRRRAVCMPGPVRMSVEELSAGAEGNWVKGGVANGKWVYELHVCQEGKSIVISLTPNGEVIRREDEETKTVGAMEVGG